MWIMWIKKWIHKNGSYGKCAGIQKIRDIKENGIRKWICVMLTKKIHIRWLKFSPIECG
ncbi:transcriptional adapter 2A [Roseburia intestinalis]|jgi:hypothetical protein|uniref:Transcriptional adapter 2A n=3 Tax=Roseburia intestinalis TaxID=166486 RepID=A0A6L6L3X9_9FIRM|nr:hypothetical protein ROSINTL182_06145 [Roseburia intestinalis L1-82]MTR84666.1 transcriptional adapter 2A [Roseburia intestinalis]RHM05389.1 transcriptional adapter 2A [Roseburia intestinalis]CBL13919.1 hypothetical protein RO1_36710 [Roseburia intestinalis XB6B4]